MGEPVESHYYDVIVEFESTCAYFLNLAGIWEVLSHLYLTSTGKRTFYFSIRNCILKSYKI